MQNNIMKIEFFTISYFDTCDVCVYVCVVCVYVCGGRDYMGDVQGSYGRLKKLRIDAQNICNLMKF